jgi:hypothetical protein
LLPDPKRPIYRERPFYKVEIDAGDIIGWTENS